MKLSIVVPVYLTKCTLDRCLESIVAQTFTNIEVILVDDGSPDRCPQMCDEWALRDPRLRVVHKQNGGLSDARNAGIEMATGDVITFVDSDDFLHPQTYEQVMPLAEESDIVEFPVIRFYGSARQSRLNFAPRTYTDKNRYWLETQAYAHTYAWNKIYKRRLFSEIRFPVDKVFEDVYTFPKLLMQAQSITTTDKGLYYYCMNQHGITATADGLALENMLEAHLETIGTWCDDAYYMHVLNIQMDVFETTGHAPILPPRHVNPLSGSLSFNQKMKALALNLLGIKRLCVLNKTIHRWTKHRS